MSEAATRLRSLWGLLANAYAVLYAPWPLFGLTVALLTAVGVLAPLIQIRATAWLIDTLASGVGAGDLLAAALPPIILLVGALAAGALGSDGVVWPYLFQRHAERVVARTTEEVYRKAMRLRLEVFEGPEYYDTLQRFLWMMQSSEVIANRLNRLQRFLARVGQAVAVLWALGQVGWMPPLALLLGCAAILRWRVHSAGQMIALTEAQTALRRRQEYWQKTLTQRPAAAEVRLFGLGPHLVGRWRAVADRLLAEVAARRRATLGRGAGMIVANVVVFGAVAASLVLAAAEGRISGGTLVALLLAVQQLLDLLDLEVDKLRVFFNGLRYLPAFLALPGEEPGGGGQGAEGRGQGAGAAPPEIVFEDVGFTYPGASRPALAGLSFTLRPGERVALVGENGAGKTTLARLLLGLYAPTSGRILVGGRELGAAGREAWRAQAGAVLQEYMRYPLTARDNIGFGRVEHLGDAMMISAAAAAGGAAGVVGRLPRGYETLLTRAFEDGVDLSLGQWQALAIARAHMRGAPLVVLDEPAAALDARAERSVYEQFLQIAQGRTVLVISHRIGSARLADRILVLEGGRLVEMGSHAELLAAGGLYAELYRMQAAWYSVER